MERSETGMTVVSAMAELFPCEGSAAPEVTDAVFEIRPPDEGAVTVIVIVGAVPRARLARVHVTVLEDWLQVHPAPVALTYVVPAGSGSVTTTEGAVAGPAFVTSRE